MLENRNNFLPSFGPIFDGSAIADSGIDRTLLPVMISGSFIGHNVYAACGPLAGDGLTRL